MPAGLPLQLLKGLLAAVEDSENEMRHSLYSVRCGMLHHELNKELKSRCQTEKMFDFKKNTEQSSHLYRNTHNFQKLYSRQCTLKLYSVKAYDFLFYFLKEVSGGERKREAKRMFNGLGFAISTLATKRKTFFLSLVHTGDLYENSLCKQILLVA